MTGFLEAIKAVLFGIVEGITEWLPISSTGHLILLDKFVTLNVSDQFKEMFNVVIQLGAILAVVVLYFKKLNPFDKGKTEKYKTATWHLWLTVIIAVLPSAVIGLLLDDWFDAHFYNPPTVAAMLIIYGVAFILLERRQANKTPTIKSTYSVSMKTAALIGCFQVLAIIPGTSRSGATILGAMLLGMSRTSAAEFSFFLAIPTMFGASALKLVKYIVKAEAAMTGTEFMVLIIGFVVAFAVSLVAIRFLMDFVKRNTFTSFGYYRIVLGALVILYFIIKTVAAPAAPVA